MSEQPSNEGTPITRRQMLQMTLVTSGGIFAADLLAACDSNPNAKTSTTPSGSGVIPTPRNQTVVVDQTQFTVFDSFNPFIPNGQEYEAGFGQVCKEFLFYDNMVTGEIKPWLATGWKYNADSTELTITLNPKVHWNDGQPFTSNDVKFTIQMLMNNVALTGGDNYRPFVKGITTPDAQTVVFSLKDKNPRFHYNFICGIVAGQEIVPEHIWSKQDPMKFKNNPPVFTGPYKLDHTIPAQFMYIWKKDPNYWNKDVMDPKPQYVIYRTAPTPDSEVEEFKRAEIDMPGFDYTHAVAIKNGGYQNIQIETKFRDPCPRAFGINSDPSKGLLADPRMHWAISYLVDRKTLGQTVWPVPTPPAQYPWADYPGNDKWSNSDLASKYPLTYDPAKAAALLDEMGAKLGSNGKRTYQGQPLHYEIASAAKVGDPEYINGQKLADELNKLGIDTTVRAYTGSVWQNKLNMGEYDIVTWWICGQVLDPGQLYTQFEVRKTKPIGQDASTGGNTLRSQYKDLDTIANQLDSVDPTDPKNKALFDQALEAYYKDLSLIPLYQTTYPTIYNTTYWTGWPTDDNLYQIPSNWWGQFLFVVGNLKPTGK
ncbi:MAG TPA: ABC transporter substrate-binding protein [Ktedonobacteraceae bacterium]|nr:ABC transporter substrate-binding protein [Ktedonobacteraceae bacterium]